MRLIRFANRVHFSLAPLPERRRDTPMSHSRFDLTWNRLYQRLGLALVIVATLDVAGCSTSPPSPRTAQDYVQVEFGKFVSGAFVDELSGKLVRMNMAYHSQDPRMLPEGYSSGKALAFWAVAPQVEIAAASPSSPRSPGCRRRGWHESRGPGWTG